LTQVIEISRLSLFFTLCCCARPYMRFGVPRGGGGTKILFFLIVAKITKIPIPRHVCIFMHMYAYLCISAYFMSLFLGQLYRQMSE